jgi:hypothetical protein
MHPLGTGQDVRSGSLTLTPAMLFELERLFQ